MKNLLRIVIAGAVLTFGAWYLFSSFNESKRKSSNFKSYQTEPTVIVPTIQPPTKVVQAPSSKQQAVPIKKIISQTSTKNKSSLQSLFVNFLDHKTSKWLWSPNVYVLEKDTYNGPKNNILGNHDGFDVIKDKTKPKNALNLIYDSVEKRLGVYTGKIIIIHQKTSEFEDKLKNIVGVNIEYLSGVYFISSEDFDNAAQLVANIQDGIPSVKIDLDINYAFDRQN